ncbi:TPA: hypothetical protein ACXIJH_005254 [Serratia marcescens]
MELDDVKDSLRLPARLRSGSVRYRTVFKQGFVDKFGPVINIKAEKWEWQTFLNLINSPDDQLSITRRYGTLIVTRSDKQQME